MKRLPWRPAVTLLSVLLLGGTACVASEPATDAIPSWDTPGDHPGSRAVYIEMPDGTKLAADLWFPPGFKASARAPALVSFTRYWRSRAFDPPQRDSSPTVDALTRAGFVTIVVDARGSGASFGTRGAEFSTCETRDFRHVVDWVAKQAWSNGRVATFGVSYTGNTAENATFEPSAALVAALAQFTDFDPYAMILFPGGLRNAFIAGVWGDGVRALDGNHVPHGEWRSGGKGGTQLLGVRPVDGDRDRTLLNAAVAQHAANRDVSAWMLGADFRDDLEFAASLGDDCRRTVAPYVFLHDPDRRRIPTYHWGSWMDAGTAAGVLARFAADPGAGSYVIGAWSHGAGFDADVFSPEHAAVTPSVGAQQRRIVAFLRPPLGESRAGAGLRRGLTYFTMGERRWKHTEQWPPAGSTPQSWYLDAGHALVRERPQAPAAYDSYRVDFAAGTGRSSRWATQLGGPDVFYGDRREADRRLLTYTSAPLERALEITGHPVVRLQLASTHADGAVIVYLEAVSPAGSVTMITEGALRLIHRRISAATPPYPQFGPYHSYERKDALPMVPGETAEIAITLLPTSVRIPKGHALRLAIAGHDQDAFHRYPAEGTPTLEVHRGGLRSSSLVLPVIESSSR